MAQKSTAHETTILQVHDLNQITKTATVRGIARHVGTTSIAVNLALDLAERGANVLLLDLCLWNCGLTLSFGHTPSSVLVDLADSFYTSGNLSFNLIASHIRKCRTNVDLLTGFEHWLASPALRAENGWNFIKALLVCANEGWDIVLADLGAQGSSTDSGEDIFSTTCAVHAAILQQAFSIVAVCDSTEHVKLWQEQDGQSPTFRDRTLYVVNKQPRELPFGLEQFELDQGTRKKTFFIPSLKDGMMANRDQLFFVERFPNPAQARSAEQKALRAIENIAVRVHR